jgi:hypothetical protein
LNSLRLCGFAGNLSLFSETQCFNLQAVFLPQSRKAAKNWAKSFFYDCFISVNFEPSFAIINSEIFSMKQTKQILAAFLIPFFLAAGSALLGEYIFPPVCTSSSEIQGEIVCFEFHNESLIETGYGLLILGLFFLSLILPPFLTRRTYQARRNKLEPASIFE